MAASSGKRSNGRLEMGARGLHENEWSKALQHLDVKCSRPRKSEGARYMSDDQLLANLQAFVCMLCPSDKRRCCNSAGALVSHQHRSHGCKNSFRRATVDDSCPACGKTFGTRAKALDHIAYRAKRCRQAFLNGSIFWSSEEETALADENDRKEAPKLGSQGWAQQRGLEASDVASTSMETCCTPCWDGCVTWLRRVFVGA